MSVQVTGRRGSHKIVLTREDEEDASLACSQLKARGFTTTSKDVLSNEEHKRLKAKIDRLCLAYVLDEPTTKHRSRRDTR